MAGQRDVSHHSAPHPSREVAYSPTEGDSSQYATIYQADGLSRVFWTGSNQINGQIKFLNSGRKEEGLRWVGIGGGGGVGGGGGGGGGLKKVSLYALRARVSTLHCRI